MTQQISTSFAASAEIHGKNILRNDYLQISFPPRKSCSIWFVCLQISRQKLHDYYPTLLAPSAIFCFQNCSCYVCGRITDVIPVIEKSG